MQDIDWSAPWYTPWRAAGERVAARVQRGAPTCEALNAEGCTGLRFVPQDALATGVPYEHYIHRSGECPTREGLHDFFNGLCWLALPQSKKRCNAIQAAQIAALGVGGVRGPVRDAITVFDENGALLHAPAALWQALVARDWQALFVGLRPLWSQAQLLIVGHALLEKLAAPRKDLTAHVWCTPCPTAHLAGADAWLAAQLTEARLAVKPFTPLPVLGVPGWWAANENFSFYADSLVFRPRRSGGQKK